MANLTPGMRNQICHQLASANWNATCQFRFSCKKVVQFTQCTMVMINKKGGEKFIKAKQLHRQVVKGSPATKFAF